MSQEPRTWNQISKCWHYDLCWLNIVDLRSSAMTQICASATDCGTQTQIYFSTTGTHGMKVDIPKPIFSSTRKIKVNYNSSIGFRVTQVLLKSLKKSGTKGQPNLATHKLIIHFLSDTITKKRQLLVKRSNVDVKPRASKGTRSRNVDWCINILKHLIQTFQPSSRDSSKLWPMINYLECEEIDFASNNAEYEIQKNEEIFSFRRD